MQGHCVPALVFVVMFTARDSQSARTLLAVGGAFVALGWLLRALTADLLPEVDLASFGLGAVLIGLVATAAGFAIGRSWRPSQQKRQEMIHHGVLAHATQCIISTDVHGIIETFSRGAERVLGYAAADVVGQVAITVLVDTRELHARLKELAAESGRTAGRASDALFCGPRTSQEPEEREWTFLRRDGQPVPVRLSLTALRDRRGAVTGFLGVASDLTEQRRAEEGRREFDVRLGKIASQVPGMVFQFKQFADGRRCFPYASDGVREVYRLDPAAVRDDSRVVWSLIHPEDVERVAASITESARTLSRWQCEYRTRFADGTIRWLGGTAMPEAQPDGAVLWHGFISDITERKGAERAHEESRVLLQSIFSSVDLGVFVVDVTPGGDFRFVEVNPAYERLTGIAAAEIRGKAPHELVPVIPAEMAECLRSSFRRGVESAGPIEYEEPFFVRGRLLWWLTRLAPLRDAAGNVIRLVGRSLDITERKTIELRFHALTERLQLATEAAQVGIWDVDVTQNRLAWDKRMHALYGTNPLAFTGELSAWRERLHPEDHARAEQEYRDLLDGKKPYNTSYRIIRRNGEEREIRASAHVQRNPAGRPTRVVGVNWDVTAERRVQADMARARDEAEKLNHLLQAALERAERLAREAAAATTAKSEFLANMSHEIRTPLNAVLGMSGLLLGTDLTGEQREFAQTIRASGDGLLALINDILDYSKIESGRLDLEHRVFDLRECVESSLDVLAGRAAEKNLDLLYQFQDGAPEVVVGDDTRLRQVMVNLLSNAVKFTTDGEVFLSVQVLAWRDDGRVRLHLAVHDTGIGIPADRMDRLFKTFSQVDASTTRQFGGTGLGLAITKRIVELMGGRIWVESTEGQGSTFHCEIETEAAPAAARPKPFLSGRVPGLSGRRVLVVTDNAATSRVLCQRLVVWGMLPRAVVSSDEAWRVIEQGDAFDLLIADAELPGLTGSEFAAQLRPRFPVAQLPVVLLSWPGRAKAAEKIGVLGCVSKPLKPSALFDVLLEVVQGRPVPRAAAEPSARSLAEQHPLSVLVVEDNPVNQRVASLMLQRLGYRADLAGNGLEAVEAAARRRYDLILMDVQMPEMDGLQATRAICARTVGLDRPRIVAMTANASTLDREQCLAAGMHDFLTKPVRTDDLLRALRETPSRAVPSAA
jgi:PAS domain S-box-containing protein